MCDDSTGIFGTGGVFFTPLVLDSHVLSLMLRFGVLVHFFPAHTLS